MMKPCDRIQEQLIDYWDWTEASPLKRDTDTHLAECPECAEQFRLWEESFLLISNVSDAAEDEEEDEWVAQEVNRNVMSRIYAEDHWLLPTSRRAYAFSGPFRRRIAGLLAGLLAVFICGLLYTLYDRLSNSGASGVGVMETASAIGVNRELSSDLYVDVPLASLSDPFVLHVTPVMPEYWIGLSLLGVVMTLLILNWFSRVRT